MVDLQQQVADAYRRSPHVANVASIIGTTGGSSGLNNGRLFVELKPRDQRPALQKVLADLRRDTARIPGISTYATPVQNLRIGGRSSRAEYQFVMQEPQSAAALRVVAEDGGRDGPRSALRRRQQRPADQRDAGDLIVDKDKASSLGISAEQLRSTLYSGFGSRQISTIYGTGDSFYVVMEFTDKTNWTTAELARRPHSQFRRQARADRRLRPHRAHSGLTHHQSAGTASRQSPSRSTCPRQALWGMRWQGSSN